MDVLKVLLIYSTFSSFFGIVYCQFDPITLYWGGSALLSFGVYLYNSGTKEPIIRDTIHRVYKKAGQILGYFEGCEEYWIPSNIKGLEKDLQHEVYGQELAVDIVLDAIRNHLSSRPSRPLVLSFHGSAGTGKNFISKKILKNMFRNAENSEYVHFFRGSIDFPLEKEKHKYMDIIHKKIKSMVYECHRSIFVFDEVEKMPSGLLDVLTGLVKTGQHGDYDFRRAIFILLSNVGEKELNKFVLQNWRVGNKREDIDRQTLQKLLFTQAFNDKGGLQHSGLVKNSIISHYVPFLPLERRHIVECLKKEVHNQNQIISDELIVKVLGELKFLPEQEELFAYAGCKNVAEHAGFFIAKQQRLRYYVK